MSWTRVIAVGIERNGWISEHFGNLTACVVIYLLGVGGKGKEVLRMTHKFLAGATGWIVDNLYQEGEGCGRRRLEGRKEELTFWHNK